MATALQLNQAHVPLHPRLRARASSAELIGRTLPPNPAHPMTHGEKVAMWEGRFAALSDVDGHYERVGRLLFEAECELAKLRSLEKPAEGHI